VGEQDQEPAGGYGLAEAWVWPGRRESNGLIFTRMSYLTGLVSGRYRLRVIFVSGWQYLADCPAPNVVIPGNR
jgi:hypothetical protein